MAKRQKKNLQDDNALILAIDQGTQSSRAMLFDQNGKALVRAQREISLSRPQPDRSEQDGDEILNSVIDCISEVLSSSVARQRKVVAAGLATQRSSVIAWDKLTGKALSPVLGWQDRRTSEWLASLQPYSKIIK